MNFCVFTRKKYFFSMAHLLDFDEICMFHNIIQGTYHPVCDICSDTYACIENHDALTLGGGMIQPYDVIKVWRCDACKQELRVLMPPSYSICLKANEHQSENA